MTKKRIGIDLGTHSMATAIRNLDKDGNQIENAIVIRYEAGVGEDSYGNEFTYSSKKTGYKSRRRNLRSLKDRKYELLKWLIQADMCPLEKVELKRWKNYKKHDKENSRQFPKDNLAFNRWLNLDFEINNLEKSQPQYANIFELKTELAQENLKDDPYQLFKMGRAFYHTCLNRGFRSSKKVSEKIDFDEEENNIDLENLSSILIGAEKKKAGKLKALLESEDYTSVSAYFAGLLTKGIRVRNNRFPEAIRKIHEEEFQQIIQKQNFDNDFITKKIKHAVFEQNPLKSQKGKIANCSYEPAKPKSYRSHYLFEEYVAWQFLDNLRIDGDNLSLKYKKELYSKIFLSRKSQNDKFLSIKNAIIKLGYAQPESNFNFKDKQTIYLCPVSATFMELFGQKWKDSIFKTNQFRNTKTEKKNNPISYNIDDLWHILKEADHHSKLIKILKEKFRFENKTVVSLLNLSNKMQDGYGNLSLKAIKNILHFLRSDFSLVESILLAKIPDIIKDDKLSEQVIEIVVAKIKEVEDSKKHIYIVNQYIADWKESDNKVGYKTSYDAKDEIQEIEILWSKNYGKKTWANLSTETKDDLVAKSLEWLQLFFDDVHRNYLEMPTYRDSVKDVIKEKLPESFAMGKKKYLLNKLYHPSERTFYNKSQTFYKEDDEIQISDVTGKPIRLLESPSHPALMNPKVLRGMNILKNHLNKLLMMREIDMTTEVVVEIARDIEDINKAKAYEIFQNQRNEERIRIKNLLKKYADRGDNANEKRAQDQEMAKYAIEQTNLFKNLNKLEAKKQSDKEFENYFKKENKKVETLVDKIVLWEEQKFQCLYSGKMIKFTDLFQPNLLQIEHTLPASRSLDNSYENKTVALREANSEKWKNMPSELDKDWYSQIKLRIEPWKQRAKKLKERRDFWRDKAKNAQAEEKDSCSVQKHLWQFEYNYWQGKVKRFEMKEINDGFISAQLNDIRIISKYVRHYLKDSGVFYKVNVVKGTTTADYRKILNIQEKNTSKDRTNHTHHAIDAATLTMIPNFPKDKEIIRKSLEYYEDYKKQYHGFMPYEDYNKSHILSLKNNVMVVYEKKDKLFVPFKRILRKRGKKVALTHYNPSIKKAEPVYERDEKGNIKFRKNNKGKYILKRDHNGMIIKNEFDGKIPLPEYVYQRGSGYRGKIYEETFYSKKADSSKYTKRQPILEAVKKPKNIVDDFLRENVKNEIKRIKKEKSHLKNKEIDKVDENYYQIDKQGNRATDSNGNPIVLRHIRCFIPSKKAEAIKPHIDSDEHSYLATPASYPICSIYEYNHLNDSDKTLKYLDTIEPDNFIKIKKTGVTENLGVFPKKQLKEFKKNGLKNYERTLKKPSYIIRKKQSVIFYKNSKNELKDIEIEDIIKYRLFQISSFEDNKGGRKIIFSNSSKNFKNIDNPQNLTSLSLDEEVKEYKLSSSNWKFVVEGYEFSISAIGNLNWNF